MRAPSLAALAAALWVGCLRPGPWWLAVGGAALLAAAALLGRRHRRAGWLVALLALVLVGAGLVGGRLAIAERGALTALAVSGGAAAMEATVVTEPRPTVHGAWTVVRVTSVEGARTRQRALLRSDGDADLPPLGARLSFRAAAQPLERDGFDAHLRRLGAVASLSVRGAPEIVAEPPGPIAASTRMRDRASAAFSARLDHDRAVLLAGLTTGDVRDRPAGQRELFAAAGLSHLVVVSGKHTALMLAGVVGLCAVLGVGARGRRLAGLTALTWFVVLVRWQPSVLRAGGMAALVLVAGLLGRARVSGRLLWAAVLLLLLMEPLLAGRLGFLLSVVATAGVLVAGPWLVARMRGPMWLRWTAAATVGAQMAVAPVLLATDGAVPPAALPANLVAGPAAAVAQALGLVSGALAQFSVPAAGWVAVAAAPFLSVILWCAEFFGEAPAVGLRDLASPVAVLLVCALVLGWRRRRALAVAVVALAVAVAVAGSWRGPDDVEGLSVTVLDVGQGDAALVEVPGPEGTARMLFDGGPEPELAVRLLRERRIGRLDVVVLSHGHYDHAAGLPSVLSRFEVGVLVVGAAPDPRQEPSVFAEAALQAASRNDVPVQPVADGDRFPLGAAQVTVLGPPDRPLAGGDLNENSVVLRVDGEHGSVLLTGDAEVEAQRRLLRRRSRLAVDVVQVPHHGAGTNAEGFLAATGAAVAMISVGADNDYGHPHPATLADLSGMTILRTDVDGSVTVVLGPDGPARQRRRLPGPRTRATARTPRGSPSGCFYTAQAATSRRRRSWRVH